MAQSTDDMAKISLDPMMTAKLKTKRAIEKRKHGSPKFQEVFRLRCRQRIREKRRQSFDLNRPSLNVSLEDIQHTLTAIMREELTDIATTSLDPKINPFSSVRNEPLDPEEALELEMEILNEEEQWILEEYEKMSQEELLALTMEQGMKQVICPLCQVSNLAQRGDEVVCTSCEFALDNGIDVKELGCIITRCVNNHSTMCKELPSFLLFPENDKKYLYVICDTCSSSMLIA